MKPEIETLKKFMQPCPVWLVCSEAPNGRLNVAPASWVTLVSYSPPMITVSLKPDKDTALNVLAKGWFTISRVPFSLAQKLHLCAKPLPRGENEADFADLPIRWAEIDGKPWPRPVQSIAWAGCMMSKRGTMVVGDHLLVVADIHTMEADGVAIQINGASSDAILYVAQGIYGCLGVTGRVKPF